MFPFKVLDLFRLFYLCEDTMLTHIKEESFFNCLTYLHPALSGIIVSLLLGENFLASEKSHTSLLYYSSCLKKPILWKEFHWSLYYNVFDLSDIVIVSITFCIQIALYLRQKNLENQRAEGIMVITYNRDDITISNRRPHQPSCHKLWRHNRTVVTPQASFFSHLLTFNLVLLSSNFLHDMGPSVLRVAGQLTISTLFCTLFFLYNFIETMFSPTLRNSLPDVFPCLYRHRRRAYHVVNV